MTPMLLVAHLLFCNHTKPNKKSKRATRPTHQDSSKMDRHNDNGRRSTTGNMGLASCGVTCLNSSVVFQINFSAGLTVLCPEIPHERQAQKRCASLYQDRKQYLTSIKVLQF